MARNTIAVLGYGPSPNAAGVMGYGAGPTSAIPPPPAGTTTPVGPRAFRILYKLQHRVLSTGRRHYAYRIMDRRAPLSVRTAYAVRGATARTGGVNLYRAVYDVIARPQSRYDASYGLRTRVNSIGSYHTEYRVRVRTALARTFSATYGVRGAVVRTYRSTYRVTARPAADLVRMAYGMRSRVRPADAVRARYAVLNRAIASATARMLYRVRARVAATTTTTATTYNVAGAAEHRYQMDYDVRTRANARYAMRYAVEGRPLSPAYGMGYGVRVRTDAGQYGMAWDIHAWAAGRRSHARRLTVVRTPLTARVH